jgi:hypothetical protein
MQKSKITVCLVFLLIALASAIFIQTASADNVYYVSMPHYGTVTSITCAFTGTDVMGDCTYTLQVKDPSSNIVFYDSGTAESGGTDVWKTIVVPLDDDSFDAGNFEVTWVLNFMSGELLTHDEYLNGYVAYYLLTVNNGGHGTTTGQGYYPSGSTAYAGLTSGTVSGATGTRYVFSSWGGDASGSNYAQSNAITMNAEKTATASWTTQYYLTVNNGGHSSATGAGWYNSGATAYAGVAASPITEGTTRYVFASWTGDASGTTYSQSNGITMNAAKTATASWTTQHLLTVTGGDSTTSGYNNGVWVNHGSTTSSTSNYVFSASATQRSNLYRWKLDSGSWTNLARSGSGTAGTGSITMDAAHTVTWESVTQNKLTVSGGNGVTYGTAPPTGDVGWYDNTQSTTVSSNGIWGRSGGSGTRVSSWKLDSGSNNNVATTGTVTTDSVTMSTYHTITFNAVTQYYLTVTGGNSITYGANPTITGDTGWYDTGSSTTVTSNWVWSTVTGQSRTVITNYAKDSVNQNPARQNTGTLTTSSITMTASHTIAFTSTTQYYLTVSGGNNIAYSLSSQTSDNWYDSGTSTTVSSDGVYNRASGTGTRTTSWRLDSGTINTVSTVNTVTTSSVTMSTYHTITFASTLQYQIYYDGGVTNTLNTITSPTVSGDNYWYDTGTPVSLSIYGVWGRTSTTGNRISAYQINGGASTPVASTSVVGILSILPITEAQNITTTTKTQYKLTVIGGSSITYGTSTPISNDEGWYDNDQSTTVSSPWIYNEFSGSRTAITNYAIDSANQNPTRQYSGTLTTSSIAMSRRTHGKLCNYNPILPNSQQ